jgi:hypothetical protein
VVQLATCCPDAEHCIPVLDKLAFSPQCRWFRADPPHYAALLTAACRWDAWRCVQAAVLSRTFRASHARLEIMWWVCQTTAIVMIAGGESIGTAGRRWMLHCAAAVQPNPSPIRMLTAMPLAAIPSHVFLVRCSSSLPTLRTPETLQSPAARCAANVGTRLQLWHQLS